MSEKALAKTIYNRNPNAGRAGFSGFDYPLTSLFSYNFCIFESTTDHNHHNVGHH